MARTDRSRPGVHYIGRRDGEAVRRGIVVLRKRSPEKRRTRQGRERGSSPKQHRREGEGFAEAGTMRKSELAS